MGYSVLGQSVVLVRSSTGSEAPVSRVTHHLWRWPCRVERSAREEEFFRRASLWMGHECVIDLRDISEFLMLYLSQCFLEMSRPVKITSTFTYAVNSYFIFLPLIICLSHMLTVWLKKQIWLDSKLFLKDSVSHKVRYIIPDLSL